MEAPALATEAAHRAHRLEWAASAYATDALLDGTLTRDVDLLVVLQGLQEEPVPRALREQLGERALAWPLAVQAEPGIIALHPATDGAEEAERAAAGVLRRLAAGEVPVALVATDRVLTRRIGALLFTRGVRVHDETGWKLSTTLAAARVMGGLRACAWDATSDAVIDWLKNVPAMGSGTVQALERRVRRSGQREWRLLRDGDWAGSEAVQGAAARVAGWRDAMQPARGVEWWQRCGTFCARPAIEALRAGSAGMKILALRLDEAGRAECLGGRMPAARGLRDFTSGFTTCWKAPSSCRRYRRRAGVVLPMSQLRAPFRSLVLPVCDEATCRRRRSPLPLDPRSAAFGLPLGSTCERSRRMALRLAGSLVDVLAPPATKRLGTCLPLCSLRARMGTPCRCPRRPAGEHATRAAPVVAAAALVPSKLSATATRTCAVPYRFFSMPCWG